MTIPGFTAEASVYKTTGQYWAAANGSKFGSQVFPMGKQCSSQCCGYCDECDNCSPGDCPPHNPNCCSSVCKLCFACRRIGKCTCDQQPSCTCTTTKCCNGNCSTSQPVQC